MTLPFVLITTHRIKPGSADRFAAVQREYFELVETNEPQLLAHFAYVNDAASEVSLVQVHPDAASADHHLQLVAPTLLAAAELIENVAIEVYGEPGPTLQGALDHNASSGVPVRVARAGTDGFSRLTATPG